MPTPVLVIMGKLTGEVVKSFEILGNGVTTSGQQTLIFEVNGDLTFAYVSAASLWTIAKINTETERSLAAWQVGEADSGSAKGF